VSAFALEDGVAISWPACHRCHALPAVVVVKVDTAHERCWCFACATIDSPGSYDWLEVPHGEEA